MEALLRPAVTAPLLLVVGYVLYWLLRPSRLPQIPVVGAQPGEWLLPLVRARWRNATDMKAATLLAYKQYRDQACLLPMAGGHDYVVLPARELQWLTEQPDTALSMHAQVMDSLQMELTVTDPKLVLHNPVHHHLITTVLTRETGNLIPALYDETQHSIDELWGTDTGGFKDLCVYETMQHVIGQVTNRIFVGLPLCRDVELLKTGIACAQDIPVTGTLLRFIWKPVRPLVALFLTIPSRIHTRKFNRIVRPEILRRLRQYDSHQADPELKTVEKEPNDFLQWSIHQAKASGDSYLSKPDTLAGRVMLLNFASIHTSSFAITHVLLDLASSEQEYIDELRAEITEVITAHGGQWNKRMLAAMPKLDSTMRESQRLNSFVTLATSRSVVAPKGIKTPSGVQLERGNVVCAPSYPVFHDPDIYPDPETFKPFRFAEKRSAAEEGTYVERARQAWATTSTEYTAFGHGRHACPGRFFASSELKLMLAYIIIHYDIELQKLRPENVWFGMNRIPPVKAIVRVKRRTE
ncbi:cytochrome P450 [Xylariales sp. AK1849]|nr:cytochrome P450 [Xylariales sp. AK1849]